MAPFMRCTTTADEVSRPTHTATARLRRERRRARRRRAQAATGPASTAACHSGWPGEQPPGEAARRRAPTGAASIQAWRRSHTAGGRVRPLGRARTEARERSHRPVVGAAAGFFTCRPHSGAARASRRAAAWSRARRRGARAAPGRTCARSAARRAGAASVIAPSAAMTASTRRAHRRERVGVRVHRAADADGAPGGAQRARGRRRSRSAALRRLVAGGAQALLERERGVRQRRGRRGGRAARRRGGGSGSGSGSPRRRRSRRASASARRPWRRAARVEHDAAAERVGRRDRAHDDAVAGARRAAAARSRSLPAARRRGRPGAPGASRVPWWTCDAHRRGVRRAASSVAVERPGDGATAPGAATTSPRATSRRSTPTRLSATRWPARGALDGLVVDLHRRARAPRVPAGQERQARRRARSRPTTACPSRPCPAPRIVKARSTCSSGSPALAPRPGRRAGDASSAARTSSTPAPVRAEHGTTSALREQLAPPRAARAPGRRGRPW